MTDSTSDLARARSVLANEADALLRLADALDGQFSAVVDCLLAVTGRVVATGMGKSGHVARKIAATLASTGTPALYVHPGEASHGDLGMIAPGDAVLALSNSGETQELGDVIAYAKRHGIPLIAITGVADSTLGRAATNALVLPPIEEACPMGLAPTTSTTMMMALGDALAVAALERRGFTPDRFRGFHPGGKLGRVLVTVSELMHGGDALPLIDAESTMADALIAMTAKGFGCVGVIDATARLVGIVTDGDLRRHMGPGLPAQPVRAVMTANPKTIAPQALGVEALRAMNAPDRRVTALFVVEDGRPVGLVHIHDLLRAGIM